jgi:two-component system sensor kinase FixL
VDDAHTEVTVTDHGKGIPPDYLERVFEPFMTTKGHGMGLGLAVCRTIVNAHCGRIWATNNADRGASFHFTLVSNGAKPVRATAQTRVNVDA